MIQSKRKSQKPTKCPNPLFEKWLEEWKQEAVERNSDIQYSYAKALESLRKFPIEMKSGKECLILKNFGTNLCAKLDKKLADYRKTDPAFFSQNMTQISTSISISHSNTDSRNPHNPMKREKPPKKFENDSVQSSPVSKKKLYAPKERSAPYAILLTFLKEMESPDFQGFLLKSDIETKAQDLCDSSFVAPQRGSLYTAWNSMGNLIKRGLVKKEGRPFRYSLTKEGEYFARNLLKNTELTALEGNINFSPFKSYQTAFETNDFSPSPSKCHWQFQINATAKIQKSLVDSFCSKTDLSNKIINIDDNNDFSITGVESVVDENIKSQLPRSCISNKKNGYTICRSPENLDSCISTSSSNRISNSNTDSASTLSSSRIPHYNTDSDTFDQLIFMPGKFEVILLVDVKEATGTCKKSNEELMRFLKNSNTNHEVRHLKVGDFTWIARNKEGKELVLPYIVERKRMDDLAGSIKDGRFHEQKFRLRQCGIPNVIYLIERHRNICQLKGLPSKTLHQAIVNTQVVDKFFIKTVNCPEQAAIYLSGVTKLVDDMFKDKTLISCPQVDMPEFDSKCDLVSLQTFNEFSKLSNKHKKLKVKDVFIKQLLQLKGMSLERATAVADKYPTPKCIKEAFESSSDPENLLTTLTYGQLKKPVGAAISKHLCSLYTRRDLP